MSKKDKEIKSSVGSVNEISDDSANAVSGGTDVRIIPGDNGGVMFVTDDLCITYAEGIDKKTDNKISTGYAVTCKSTKTQQTMLADMNK